MKCLFFRRVECLLIFGLLFMAPAIGWSFECKVSERFDFVSIRWNSRTVPFFTQAGITEIEFRAIEDAFGAWSQRSCTDLRFAWQGSEPEPPRAGLNLVRFVDKNWIQEGDVIRSDRAVAITLTTFGLDTGSIRHATIEVNREFFNFADVPNVYDDLAQCSDDYDLISVITHEVGHFIGLDHTQAFVNSSLDPTMAPEVGACEASKRTLEEDDLEGLCLLYPAGKTGGSCDPLPVDGDQVIQNEAFGCANKSPVKGFGWAGVGEWGLWVALFLFVLRRRHQVPTCSWSRSRG